ncbi:DegT/DnrJ/EryC1/StrS aminotransferase family protein [Candidatus Pelagibacter sp. HIMB1506]|uniref:DegT/DnrJ/EryC1/StrS aminotransferase family protein n=1 Tax=Candidatus Pelagibacter sp. HIMB1506 TaxID=3413337 RepID=UPI003F86F529
MQTKIHYPLLENAFDKKDIELGVKVIKSKQLTMSNITRNFEKKFSKYLGVKYAVMVNSGSSANLLSIFVAKYSHKLKIGDEVIIPTVCWSTSLWPIIQAGLKPVFVDVNLTDYNASIEEIKLRINKKTKAILLVHVLGTSLKIDKLLKIIRGKNILVIEDTCESLGSKYKKKYLGTYGNFGTFSFYYSHQITSGEGGMIVTNNKKDYELLKIMRAHGWDRDLEKNRIKTKKFNFINMGFNLRPLEVSAAIAQNQLKRLKKFSKLRNQNREKIILKLKQHKNWKNQYKFVVPEKHLEPSWFGLPFLLKEKFVKKKNLIIKNLNKFGIETRPIISGNFLNQKASKIYNLNKKKEKFPNAEYIEKAGFFIGLHTKKLKNKELEILTNHLLNF